MNRRNILTILGLASVATPAISADDITDKSKDSLLKLSDGKGIQLAKYDPERMAIALERLVSEIRNQGVAVSRFHIGTEVGNGDLLIQTLTIDIELHHDLGSS